MNKEKSQIQNELITASYVGIILEAILALLMRPLLANFFISVVPGDFLLGIGFTVAACIGIAKVPGTRKLFPVALLIASIVFLFYAVISTAKLF